METSSSECSLWDCLITRPLVVRVDECNPSGRSIITAKLSSLWIYKSDFTEHDHHHLFSFSYIHENISHSSLKNKYKLMRETEEAATNLSNGFVFVVLFPQNREITLESNFDGHCQQTSAIKVNCVNQCNS